MVRPQVEMEIVGAVVLRSNDGPDSQFMVGIPWWMAQVGGCYERAAEALSKLRESTHERWLGEPGEWSPCPTMEEAESALLAVGF